MALVLHVFSQRVLVGLALFVTISCVCANLRAQTQRSESAERPNIVLILADDLGYETVGCYGGTSYPTPNIDRLAREGIRFDHAYAMPLCTNTRIQLMTGLYNNRNWKSFGILDPQADTFSHMLQRAGYKTCIAGKWQLTSYDPPDFPGARLRRNTGMRVQDAGYHEYSLWHTGHTEAKGSRYADPVIYQNGQFRSDTEGKYGPDLWVEFISNFMTRHRDEPFFVYYPMALPHNPMNPTPDSPEWADRARRDSDETPFAADMIRYTDKLLGKLVDKTKSLGIAEKTLIIFYSDNGTNNRVASMMGDRRVRGGKSYGTDLGIRVPMIAYWKGTTPKGKVCKDLIDSVDFLPTILDVAGAYDEIHSEIDGLSFAPVIKGTGSGRRETVYIHQDPRPGWDKDRFRLIRLARDREYKLFEDGRLFCTRDDPFERSPLFVNQDQEEAHAARVKLQRVLDSMRPYPTFDPVEMPRPNPTEPIENNEFHDQGGYIVAEAEMLPTPRDESWDSESKLPDYGGTGYLRSLREQPDRLDLKRARGITTMHANAHTAGPWAIALRCRSDHYQVDAERSVWIRVGDGPWLVAALPEIVRSGQWAWTDLFLDPKTGKRVSHVFQFTEKRNDIQIAPRSPNIKIDRIVAYESDQAARALDLKTPVSPFHPWASP